MKQLLIECMNFAPTKKVLVEAAGGDTSKLIVSGVVQRAEEPNQNKRRYPRKVLGPVVERYMQLVKERRAIGELDHPESEIITLANTSHLITDLWWKGNDLYGKIEILPTPSGNILKKLFEHDVTVGISSRGAGSVREIANSEVEVLDDFELICWDFVSNPSTHGAFMKPVTESLIKESVDPKLVCRNKIDCLITEILIDLNRK